MNPSDLVFVLQVFLEVKLVKEESVTWKRKLVRHGLEEVQKRRCKCGDNLLLNVLYCTGVHCTVL